MCPEYSTKNTEEKRFVVRTYTLHMRGTIYRRRQVKPGPGDAIQKYWHAYYPLQFVLEEDSLFFDITAYSEAEAIDVIKQQDSTLEFVETVHVY